MLEHVERSLGRKFFNELGTPKRYAGFKHIKSVPTRLERGWNALGRLERFWEVGEGDAYVKGSALCAMQGLYSHASFHRDAVAASSRNQVFEGSQQSSHRALCLS